MLNQKKKQNMNNQESMYKVGVLETPTSRRIHISPLGYIRKTKGEGLRLPVFHPTTTEGMTLYEIELISGYMADFDEMFEAVKYFSENPDESIYSPNNKPNQAQLRHD